MFSIERGGEGLVGYVERREELVGYVERGKGLWVHRGGRGLLVYMCM